MYRSLFLAALLLISAASPAAAQTRRGDDLARLLRYPDITRRYDRLRLRRRHLDRPGRGRHRTPAHVASRARTLPEVLARRSLDRLLRRVRRHTAGLRHPRRRRRAAPAHLLQRRWAALPPRGGYDNRVLDWTPDGKNVLFRAHRVPQSDRLGRPYLVPVEGGMEQPLAITEAGGVSYSPDGRRVAFTPDLERVPRLEALPRRPVARRLDLRPHGQHRRADHRHARAGQIARLARRHDLLCLRPRLDDEPLRLRHAHKEDAEGDEPHRLRRALAARATATRSSTRRAATSIVSTRSRARRSASPSASTATSPTPSRTSATSAQHRDLLRLADRRACALRRARRHLHRAREGGRGAQPDRDAGRARE